MNSHHRGDARIKFSIGTNQEADTASVFCHPRGLAFDHHRGLLFVADSSNDRVQVFSSDDGSLVPTFGAHTSQTERFNRPYDIAIDHDHNLSVVLDTGTGRIVSFLLDDQSFLSVLGKQDSRCFAHPKGIAIDKHHRRIIVADTTSNRLMFLSSTDGSFLFAIGKLGTQPGEFRGPSGVAIDHDRHRIIVSDSYNNRVQVLSLIDGSFLFLFGSEGNQPGQFKHANGVCIANQGRIIIADSNNDRLQAFTHEGHHISSLDCGNYECPVGVAFDEHRGLIAFSAGNRVHVIGANQWLADTKFTWRPDRHRYAPSSMKQAILTMTMIRSVVDESAMSMIPNELLFEIFSFF